MDEQRREAYLRLINVLLNCQSGEEQQLILNGNRDLVDAGLVQTMVQVAEELRHRGNQNTANFLMNFAYWLAGVLELSSSAPTFTLVSHSGSQLDFLLQILQAVDQSSVNYQVIYSLLQTNLDKLDDNFAQLLQDWATDTLSRAEPEQAQSLARIIGDFSTLIQQFPLGNQARNLEIALTGYNIVATVFTREAFPQYWVMLQNEIGVAYSNRILGNRAENLEVSIRSYLAALEVGSRAVFPELWATIQNNLGTAYLDRIQEDRSENVEAAIRSFLAALEVRTREVFPRQWATIQNNLGNAYLYRIQEDRAENLETAICCYLSALEVYTRSSFPQQWSSIQNNLGKVYWSRIQGDRAENLEAAINFYLASLEVRTRDTFPRDWAETQKNLGAAYYDRIRGNRAENLEAAIYCYQAALEVQTRQAYSEQWADLQIHLGNIYRERVQGDKAENLEAAIHCYQTALEVHTREAYPNLWADIQVNLGNVYQDRIRGSRAENLETVIYCYSEALTIQTRQAFPEEWARIQHNLGNVYRYRILGERAENLEAAISHCLAALEVRTRDALPSLWASTQNNLGNNYAERIRGENIENLRTALGCFSAALKVCTCQADPTLWAKNQNDKGSVYLTLILAERSYRIREGKAGILELAIECYLAALEVYTRETFPEEWARVQNGLGAVYLYHILGDQAENLEAAISYFLAALEVYTPSTFPEDWANIQNNLGNVYLCRLKGERLENLQAAIHHYSDALDIYTREDIPLRHIATQLNLSFVYQILQRFHDAYTALATAIDTVESLRGEIFSGSNKEADKQKLAEEWYELYGCMVKVCIELDKPTEALTYVERSKAQNLVELLATRDLYPKGDIPESVLSQLQQLRKEISVEQRQQEIEAWNRLWEQRQQEIEASNQFEKGEAGMQLIAPSQDYTKLELLQQQLNELITREIQPYDPGFSLTQKVEPICFEQIQQLLSDPQTVLIEWYLVNQVDKRILASDESIVTIDESIIAFVVTHQSPTPIVWQSSSEERQALENWFDDYQVAYHSDRQKWQIDLGDRLQQLAVILHLDHLLSLIPTDCQQLILIPHRLLHMLPLHALPLSNNKQESGLSQPNWLLDKFPRGVRYAPSCQLLQLGQKQQRPEFSQLFALQNPTGDLNYTNLEIETIRSFFIKTQVLAKQAATKVALNNNQDFKEAHCVHFSCHGFFNFVSPLESALILANDERLTLAEIFSLTLNKCRLITLSACETGIADPHSISDEYISLPSGLLYAGSSSVVSSLWTVSDISTAFLMIKFYENLQSQHSVSVALNQAQCWLRDLTKIKLEEWITEHQLKLDSTLRMQVRRRFYNMPDDAHPFQLPFYWAPFCAVC